MSLEINLLHRQKLLLALLQALGGTVGKTDFQKYLFLFTEKYQAKKSYEFVPYLYGCFSFQSDVDLAKLQNIGLLQRRESWSLAGNGTDYLSEVHNTERQQIFDFKKNYEHLKGKNLMRFVYQNYPYYAIKSCRAQEIMNKNEFKKIKSCEIKRNNFEFFTIGYEGKTLEKYINELIKNDVRLVCDVRKNPLSRKYGFSKIKLSEHLKKFDIGYEHIPKLGVVSEKRQELNSYQDYENLFIDYKKHVLPENLITLKKLKKIFLNNKRIAITCFEQDHKMCHRNCITQYFSQQPQWKHQISHL